MLTRAGRTRLLPPAGQGRRQIATRGHGLARRPQQPSDGVPRAEGGPRAGSEAGGDDGAAFAPAARAGAHVRTCARSASTCHPPGPAVVRGCPGTDVLLCLCPSQVWDSWTMQLSLSTMSAMPQRVSQRSRESQEEKEEDLHMVSSCVGLMWLRSECILPFQPHRADAGAARTFPGRSQKRVSVTVIGNSLDAMKPEHHGH